MRSFLIRTGIFAMLLVSILVGACLVSNQENASVGFLGAHLDKQQRLQSIDSPKIVLVGGSNLAFGINTREVASRLDCEAVNMAVHASLGLRFMIESVLPYIKTGDRLVVIPEYAQFTDTFLGKQELVSLVLDVDRGGWKHLPLSQRLFLLPQFITYAAKDIYAMILRRRFPQLPGNESVYRRDAFNEYGDIRVHWDMPSIEIGAATELKECPQLDAAAFGYLARVKNELEIRGARLVLLPPVYRRESYENQRPLIEGVAEGLKEHGIGFEAECERYCLANDLFFDSHYHPTREGTVLRTQLVSEDLN